MIVSIYLHKQIAETLKCYGNLTEVMDRILTHCEQGDIDLMDKPKTPPRNTASRYDIDVTNEYYLDMLTSFPPNSTRISLRRLLYWFVENEMFDVLGWEPVNEYKSSDKERILKRLNAISSDLFKLKRIFNEDELIWANIVLKNLDDLKETVEDGR